MAAATATPTLIVPRQTYTTNASYYEGGTLGDCGGTGTVKVFEGPITSDTCFQIVNYSDQVQNLPDVDCTFVQYSGKACDKDITGTIPMPAGDGSICVPGVFDGGSGPVSFLFLLSAWLGLY